MSRKRKFVKWSALMLSTFFLLTLSVVFSSATAYAAGWLDYVQDLTLGDTVSGSLKKGDYYGLPEVNSGSYYWHIYKISMPKDGLLNMYIESASSEYLSYGYMNYSTKYHGFAIFSGSSPDNLIWRSCGGENTIKSNYNASRAMYYGSTEISLEQGEYYFVIRRESTVDTPYYLTLSYKEPVINVTSITLNPSKMAMEVGEQRNITANILPNNATDKTVIWRSNNPSVAVVDNGTVTAVSNGTASITAASADGEISATCAVTVNCIHNYQTTVTPANTKSNGRIVDTCTKCGNSKSQTIYKISRVSLSAASYTYNGKIRKPSVAVTDTQGNVLANGQDYKVSYPGIAAQLGIYGVDIEFTGNYSGTVRKQFKVSPKAVGIVKITPKKKGIALKWKKTIAGCGYEIAYSTSKKFAKKSTRIVDIKNYKTTAKTIKRLKPKQKYYARIRTYKSVKLNKKTTKLYSRWSKIKTVTTKK
ncbi:Ig-like domain-containing protein [Lachnospiraceae bacterium 45-W7]